MIIPKGGVFEKKDLFLDEGQNSLAHRIQRKVLKLVLRFSVAQKP